MTQNYQQKVIAQMADARRNYAELGMGNYSDAQACAQATENAETSAAAAQQTDQAVQASQIVQISQPAQAPQTADQTDGETMIQVIDPSLCVSPTSPTGEAVLASQDELGGTPAINILNTPTTGEPLFPAAATPLFRVPRNPLLPPEYQEILTFDAIQYINGFLRTQIGNFVTIEQYINASQQNTLYGYIVGVGINYVLIQNSENVVTMVDIYTIKNVIINYAVEPIQV